jgi:enoyl-CoA hydratase/carnithine racemase
VTGEGRQVSLEVSEKVAVITLRREDSTNCFSDVMEAQLIEAFDRCDADDEVRVVILTGHGRSFCAGMDLQEGESPFVNWRTSPDAPEGSIVGVDPQGLPIRRDGGGRVALRIFESKKPVIAAINGAAVGVGVTMTLPADIRLAAREARLGFVFNRRGLMPEACSSWFLPRLVGMQTALEWVFTGRVLGAEEAHQQGLVHAVYPREELLDAARRLALEIANNTAPVSTAITRQLFWRMLGAAHPIQAHGFETRALNDRGVSADAHEGISSFLEKREAKFPDRVSTDLPDVLADYPAPTLHVPNT